MIVKERKKELIEEYGGRSGNTGSASSQIALLTERIRGLEKHFEKFRKDFTSKRGFLKMVGRRKRLLKYLKKSQPSKYSEVVKKLNLT